MICRSGGARSPRSGAPVPAARLRHGWRGGQGPGRSVNAHHPSAPQHRAFPIPELGKDRGLFYVGGATFNLKESFLRKVNVSWKWRGYNDSSMTNDRPPLIWSVEKCRSTWEEGEQKQGRVGGILREVGLCDNATHQRESKYDNPLHRIS